MQRVDHEGDFLLTSEGDPAAPLRPVVVQAADAHERRERLVQPDPVPPFHGHEIPEPHVGDLVLDYLCDAGDLGDRGRLGIAEEICLPERHAAEVLHGALGEVGDVDEVELRPRVGETEILRIPVKGVHGDVESEG